MKLTVRSSTVSGYLGLVLTLLIIAGCDGSNGGPTTPAGFPVISNLTAAFGTACTVQGLAGTIFSRSFDYTDSDGNVVGGKIQTTSTFQPSGSSSPDLVFNIPSPGVTINGTTSGTITFRTCIRFGSQTAVTTAVAILDAANNSSNVLSIQVARPAGAPAVRAGDDGGVIGPLE